MAAVRTPDAGKPAVQVPAVKIAVDHFPHIRAEESVPPTELLVIDLLESLKVIFYAVVIGRILRATRTVLMCAGVNCRCCQCLFHNNRQ